MKSAVGSQPCLSAPDPVFATVLVGKECKRFVVHESLLIHYSDFFRAALTGKFAEATDKTVKLEEDDAEIFEFFVHWLYYNRCPDDEKGDDAQLVDRFYFEGFPSASKTFKLYVFGDKYGVVRLRNDTINLLYDRMVYLDDDLPCPELVSYAFRHLKARDPICRLLVDVFCYNDDIFSISDRADYKCIPFLQAIWDRYIHHVYGSASFQLTLCDYHEHDTVEERKACKGTARSGE
ncbi:hypothetical protein EKO04_008115 [Ascochyta lentis]|uniref:BTB domain-containing protein n=1 Tax=Ascochyta lentis TaxID=205686 RepID=A0A8H7MG76_9PLEO|nr:hypothetical protein EKO04_008115 [Ascochyta lentis]